MTMTPDPSTFAAPSGDPKHTYDASDVAGIDKAVAYVFAMLSAYRNKKDTANPQEPFATTTTQAHPLKPWNNDVSEEGPISFL